LLSLIRKGSPKFDQGVREAFDMALQQSWDEMETKLRLPGRYGEKVALEEVGIEE
jgi:hypothetical protein